ncbi:MAG: sulfite exporter TauE/SafE family protein [Candidatus Heimdallarchaeaceae archaeon]
MEPMIIYTFGYYVLFSFIAFISEYIDSALGGGYGTILVPILLILRVDGTILIPTVLLTEIFTGFGAAILHHFAGNANFSIRVKKIKILTDGGGIKISEDFKISIVLAICGIGGGIFAAFIGVTLNPKTIATYIGVVVICMGVLVFTKLKWHFTWWKIILLGTLAAFNKGLGGGGYGPLISSGQIVVERNPRQAIASTSFSEAFVCIASLIVYLVMNNAILSLSFYYLVIALLIGSLCSVPFAVLTVKYLPIDKMSVLIGIIAILLGLFTIIKTYILVN